MSPQEFYPWSSFNHCFPCRLVVAVRPIKKGDLCEISWSCSTSQSYVVPYSIPFSTWTWDDICLGIFQIYMWSWNGLSSTLLDLVLRSTFCVDALRIWSACLFRYTTIPYFQVVGRFQMLAVHLGFHLWFLVAAAKSLAFQGAVFSNAVFAAKTFATASCPVTYSGEDTWWGSAVGWGTAGDIPAKFGWRFPQWQIFHDFFLEHLVFFIRN